jgi:hypothetical protein
VTEGRSSTEIESLLREQGVPSSERSIRRAKRRWGLTDSKPQEPEAAGIEFKGDTARLIGKASKKLNTAEDLMRERGLNPADWEVVSMTINEWEGPIKGGGKQPLKQLKIHLRRVVLLEMVAPARIDGPKFQARTKPTEEGEPTRFVLCGDQQAPYYNKALHDVFCQFLYDYAPHRGVLIGDTIDFPDISRHPDNPEKDCTVQDCLDSGYVVLRNYREAHELCKWQKLAGNHDERLRRYQIDKFNKAYGVRRALVPGEEPESPVLDIGHLMRLDELDIDYVKPDGDYEHTQINLSTHLAARHGWIARKGSGASALATLEHLGFSVVVGHTHRQSLVHKTRHDINGNLTTLAACETGCMCLIEGGLGYAVTPDWQNGFATAEIWPDGTFKLDLATYVNGVLYHRDKRYS